MNLVYSRLFKNLSSMCDPFQIRQTLLQPNLAHTHVSISRVTVCPSVFGGLEVASWPLVPKFAGSHPAEAFGFLGRKKSSTRLPSEEK
jgi:hypothetical protein